MQPPAPAQPYLRPPSALDRKTMGKYEVLCRLAAGGMAEIFLAYQRGLAGFRKIVVLKSILPDIRGEEELTRMFLAEAQITAQFQHPHIAQVFDLDIDGDVLFLAMEFVQGCTLIELARSLDKAKEPMPIGFTLRAVRDTALALHYAHTFTDPRGRKQVVIHRDVAEKNIMVTHEGITKLLDFGIAKSGERKMTMVGTVKGSTGYMSPEQIRGETVDIRTDVFSLGVVLHECLTGYRLFRGRTHEESMMKALEGDVTPPSMVNPAVPPALDVVVLKALERNREQRHGTALELAREIERVAGQQLWSPEQCGAVVQKHFASRQVAVRDLILAMDASGESGISDVVAAIQAAKGAPLAAAAGPLMPPPLPPASDLTMPASISDVQRMLPPDLTVPAPISDVVREIGRQDERTEQLPAHTRPIPSPTPIDFSLSPDPEPTPSEPVVVLDHVTDLNTAHVPANPPAPPKGAGPVSTEVVATLLQSAPPPPLARPPPVLSPPLASRGPTPLEIMQEKTTAPGLRPAASPPSPSRRIRRKAKSRAPLYGLIVLVWAAAAVAVMMVLQVGPFARPVVPVVVAPPQPPPGPVEPPQPQPPEPAVAPAPDPQSEPDPQPVLEPEPAPQAEPPAEAKPSPHPIKPKRPRH